MVASKVDDVNRSVNEVKELQQNTKQVANEINDRVKKLASVIDRHLPAWAVQAAYAEQLKLCPTVVVITPSAVDGPIDLKTWFKNVKEQKYQLVFYCERSGQPGHEPFEISVDRKWMVKVAPWLRIAINIGAAWDPSKVSPAVLKEFPLPVHSKEMEALIKALGKEENVGQLQTLQGDALEAIAKMANEEENLKKWRNEMEPVVGENGRGHAEILRRVQEYAQVEKDGASLGTVMTTRKDEPVELSYQYIKRCITNRKLGSGAFGDVFLAEDSRLPKKFVVKMITLSERSDGGGPNEDNLKNFQKELSTLKRLHHPNILDLYGYSYKGGAGEQFLVYEYTANGSLDGFLKDDVMRARLPADKRLSIMYEVARAVHFLHTGGAGFKVFHSDIKSANIYLTEDFTPRLIDCGLAKFVEDERNASWSATTKQTGLTEGPAIGTIGYMCPGYTWNKENHITCDYIPAFDVYSLGVVMAELVLGRLNDGKTTKRLKDIRLEWGNSCR
ncbi:serine/threonine kinase [Fragilaria crotonensis]|nr:serine/threonine kinase [Fragilaria crotonensis]